MDRSLYKSIRGQLDFGHQGAKLALYALEDVVLWTGTIFLMMQSSWFTWFAALPFALLMFRNFAFMHEAVHGIASPSYKLNYIFGLMAGAVCFLPFSLWKAIHIEHHYWTGNFEKDPVLEVVKRYPSSSSLMKGVFTLMWRTRFPLMAFFQYIVFWAHSIVRLAKNYRDPAWWVSLIGPLALWGALGWLLNAQQIGVLCLGIFLYSLLFDFINLPHHVGVYSYDPDERKGVWDQHSVVRSCRYPWLIEHLVLNFNFHTEHHMMPDLPWHELPAAHQRIQKANSNLGEFHFIRAGWLAKQRKKTFAEFLRPDVYSFGQKQKNKAA